MCTASIKVNTCDKMCYILRANYIEIIQIEIVENKSNKYIDVSTEGNK